MMNDHSLAPVQWAPPDTYAPPGGHLAPAPAPGAMSPQASAFLAEFAALRESVQQQNAALARYQQAPPPVPMAPAPPVHYQAPQYQAPTYTAPQYGAYAPVFKPTIVVSAAASHDDHSTAGHWWPLAFACLFFLPFAAVAVSGGGR
jgi:hypothetical protein